MFFQLFRWKYTHVVTIWLYERFHEFKSTVNKRTSFYWHQQKRSYKRMKSSTQTYRSHYFHFQSSDICYFPEQHTNVRLCTSDRSFQPRIDSLDMTAIFHRWSTEANESTYQIWTRWIIGGNFVTNGNFTVACAFAQNRTHVEKIWERWRQTQKLSEI